MNKCIFQLWEESQRDGIILSDGCSIHLSETDRDTYIKNIYSQRDSEVPDSYDRVVGLGVETFVSDILFEKLQKEKVIRLNEIEKNNLISMEEILFKPNT
jgi:uncharacterized protein YutD